VINMGDNAEISYVFHKVFLKKALQGMLGGFFCHVS